MITENLWTVSRHVSTKSWPRHSTARDTQKIARYVYMHISCIYIYTKPERYLFNKRPHDFGGIHLSVVHVHPLPAKIISTKKLPLPKKTTSQNPPLPKKQKQIKKNKIPKSLGQKIPSQKKSVGPKNPFPKSKKKRLLGHPRNSHDWCFHEPVSWKCRFDSCFFSMGNDAKFHHTYLLQVAT